MSAVNTGKHTVIWKGAQRRPRYMKGRDPLDFLRDFQTDIKSTLFQTQHSTQTSSPETFRCLSFLLMLVN